MDPLTQAVLGGAIGQAGFHRRLGPRAVLAGAVVAALPDLDVFYHIDQWSEWQFHRGITHSLLTLPIAGAAIGYALWRLERRQDRATKTGKADAAMARLRAWIWLCVLALLSHPLLDLCTSYGTQLLAPLSDRRFALDAIAVIDPGYTVPLLAAVIVGLRRGGSWRLARGAAIAALILSHAYLGFAWWLNARAETLAARQLARDGVAAVEVTSYPTIFQPFLRRIVARTPAEIRIGFLTLLEPRPIRWQVFAPPEHPLIEKLREMPEGRLLDWFAMGQTLYRVEETASGTRVEGSDLRYGAPTAGMAGMWGIEAAFDDGGRLLAPPGRFSRRPPLDLVSLAMLWRWTIGTAEIDGGPAATPDP